ncbi:glycoside hydrolase family 9 protein [Pedobacter sp. MR22-3]|uniref:glycoside hydrolase family 9 protein n=1 Tax=Pedobacter sp. MR22-3 TaxID=2994552 RepID=UPI0022455094|nr:glycoside hydrolase family 9 protein [Pedobacter sp. MR22-3]MCX2584703.1 glycoside hydrolase family 9 protein [Pedobacter sp. MR22-3]
MKIYVVLLMLIGMGLTEAQAQKAVHQAILVDQSGFYPGLDKRAVIIKAAAGDGFELIAMPAGKPVYTGALSGLKSTGYSGIKTRIADFSSFQQPGNYLIRVPGVGDSPVFRIADSVHQDLALAGLKAFYYQRASSALDKDYAGKWYRAPGHPDTAVLIHPSAATKNRAAGSRINVAGGWYDAGDYNKYIVNSGISTATLLSAYEDFPDYFLKLKTRLPDAKNRVPDILTEAIYNLRWMLKMQDQHDGGVYNKCTNLSFDAMVMPAQALAPRYVVAKGTAATLNLAAVAAQASRILKDFPEQYPGLADSCRAAAILAWKWALKNPNLPYDQELMNKTTDLKVTTGAYGDKDFEDEWSWAAAELLATTGESPYYEAFFARLNAKVNLPSWSSVGILGYYSLIRCHDKLPASYSSITSILKKKVLSIADRYLLEVKTSAYGSVMGSSRSDFVWGSNSVAMNQSVLLINAYLFTQNKDYLNAAAGNLDYILGRNATGYSFVTGIGTYSPMNPHHRISFADGVADPVPGMLVGGPNPEKQDGLKYESAEPELSYLDNVASYASNEIAINWNAPLVYVANALECLQKKGKESTK